MLEEMLFIVISIFLIESINAATPNSYGFDREQLNFISALNTQRQEIATSYYTVNMKKLVWNKELQSIAEQYNHTLPNRNFRMVRALDYTNGAQHLNTAFYIKYCGRKKEDQYLASNVYHDGLEHLNPLQTMIGCARKTEKELGAGYTVMCLVGPSPALQMPSCDKSPSICTLDHFKLENGFCLNSDLPDSDQLMYISALNEKRRQFAAEQQIPNMNKLVWSKTLHDTALSEVKNINPWFPDKLVQRATAFVEFEDGLEDISEDKTRLFGNLLNPLQRGIACVTFDEEQTRHFKYLCVLGPQIESKKWAKGQPGSQCDSKYVDNNGLCSIAKTSETPPPPQESQVLTPSTKPPVCNPTEAVTSGTIQPPLTRYTTEKLTPEPRPQLPKELEDYEEIDGDEYDPDFPTQPPRKYYFY